MNIAPQMYISDKVVLRKPSIEDIVERLQYGMTESLAELTGFGYDLIGCYTYDDAEAWYTRILDHPCKWIIAYDTKLIGTVSLRYDSSHRKCKYAIEIYEDKLLNKGIGSKVTMKVLSYAFETLDCNKVFLRVFEYNKRAINCYKKCGFIIEGIDREGVYINDRYQTDVYMGILRQDYYIGVI